MSGGGGVDVTAEGRRFIEEIDGFCGFNRRWLVRLEEPTDERYGWLPRSRPLEKYIEYGVINLDKPPGPTSHEVVAWIKRMFGVQRAGHGGTLEPQPHGGGAGRP
ncbi:MAG: tRNA pseudouridine synthase A [Desulfurococcales archaeon]|nr:tRNA pseudouridine synthase A [Desulfurococcales archaeon]